MYVNNFLKTYFLFYKIKLFGKENGDYEVTNMFFYIYTGVVKNNVNKYRFIVLPGGYKNANKVYDSYLCMDTKTRREKMRHDMENQTG